MLTTSISEMPLDRHDRLLVQRWPLCRVELFGEVPDLFMRRVKENKDSPWGGPTVILGEIPREGPLGPLLIP